MSEKLRIRFRFVYLTPEDARRACAIWFSNATAHDFTEHVGEDPSGWSNVVYEALDAQGRPLYTGRTIRLPRRLRQHRASAPWWPEVASITAGLVPCIGQSLAYEAIRIKDIRPPYNQRLSQATTYWPKRLLRSAAS